jgi:hypothetical protein
VLFKITLILDRAFLRRKIIMAVNTLPDVAPSDLAMAAQLTSCDRCGARGKYLVVLNSGLDLVFCGHHASQVAGTVVGVASVTDLTD